MISHLYLHYAKISPSDLTNNNNAMEKVYDPNLPIENIFEQINDAAAAKIHISTPKLKPSHTSLSSTQVSLD